MFATCQNKGFHITFANGVTISVQFGPGNYCARKDAESDSTSGQSYWESDTAEVAILLPGGEFYRISEYDDVIGWQTAEDVAKWIEVARNL